MLMKGFLQKRVLNSLSSMGLNVLCCFNVALSCLDKLFLWKAAWHHT